VNLEGSFSTPSSAAPNSVSSGMYFEHLGEKLFCVDTPESWRVLTNTTGGIYRLGFVDSIGYSISTSPTDDIHHEINTYTADCIEQAIQQFKEKVTKIQTGKDRIKEYY
jgi:hypothetical protein